MIFRIPMPSLTTPKRLPAMVLLVAVFAPAFVMQLEAQPSVPAAATAGPEVAVRNVTFANVRPSNGGDAWLEATVELDVRGDPTAGAYARFVDRVQVALSISVRKRAGDYEFFRGSAETVSLETGRAAIRFYLPPEIVRREQINTDPFAWLVEISAGGKTIAPTAGSASASIRTADALRSFKDRVAQAAPQNDGVFVPQFLSPFALDYGRDTPAFIRRGR
jgi:hypothetical protein